MQQLAKLHKCKSSSVLWLAFPEDDRHLDTMDDELKSLMKKLGQVINETLTDSPKINVAIQEIREAGYEVFLIIEASIGFNKKLRGDDIEAEPSVHSDDAGKVRLRINADDVKFLKSLKIAVEVDNK